MVPTFAYKATHREPVTIYGTGASVGNLVHASQVARVLIEALDHASTEVPNFHGASEGGNFTTREVWEMVRNYTLAPEATYIPMRDGETDATWAGMRQESVWSQRMALGFFPQFNIHDLHQTIDYYKELQI